MTKKETIKKVKDFFKEHSNAEDAKFASKLIFTKYKINGCKTPLNVAFAKALLKEAVDIYDMPLDDYDEIILAGHVLAFSKMDAKEKIKYLDEYINLIDNWAICDCVVCKLKKVESEKDYFYSLLQSGEEFRIRVGIIWLMRYDLKNNTKDIVDRICKIRHDAYYDKMAQAWCLAEAILIDYDYVFKKLLQVDDKFIRNKTISKACDSFRVTDAQKEELRKIRLKA